jgi:hypothetical protein
MGNQRSHTKLENPRLNLTLSTPGSFDHGARKHLFDREPDGLRRSAKASVTNWAAATFTSRRKEIGPRDGVKSGHSPS